MPNRDAYFWKGMACVALKRDQEAREAIQKALAYSIPPILLAPLRWLESDLYSEFLLIQEQHI